MKKSGSIIENRRKKISLLLQQNGVVQVKQLAEQLQTSPPTIRRDLEHFESIGVAERFYGGARLVVSNDEMVNIFSSNLIYHKHALARQAAGLVEDGDTIFINTSSTALLLLKYITAKQVTVITNNGKAIFSEKREDMIVCLTGGEMRMPKESMVGDFAINNLNRVTAAKCFLGCSELSADSGLTTAVLQEAAVNELMLQRVVGARVVLADHIKIGRTHSFPFGPASRITHLFTDTQADPAALRGIRRVNPDIQIIQVEPVREID